MSESKEIATIATKDDLKPILFPVGRVVATPGAVDLLDRTGIDASTLLHHHQCGEWGTVCEQDGLLNKEAIALGRRILSAYKLGHHAGERLWIITEWDRSVTTFLLPGEY